MHRHSAQGSQAEVCAYYHTKSITRTHDSHPLLLCLPSPFPLLLVHCMPFRISKSASVIDWGSVNMGLLWLRGRVRVRPARLTVDLTSEQQRGKKRKTHFKSQHGDNNNKAPASEVWGDVVFENPSWGAAALVVFAVLRWGIQGYRGVAKLTLALQAHSATRPRHVVLLTAQLLKRRYIPSRQTKRT